jgi:hypothetical protein
MDSRRETHLLASFVHGALAALHALGVVYNIRKGNRWQTYAHVAGIAFSVHSTFHHVQESCDLSHRIVENTSRS